MERPALATIDERIEQGLARVIVTLAWRGRAYEGESIGSTDRTLRPRLVGEATLRAAEQISNGQLAFDLSATGTTDLGEARIALAQVREEGRRETLVGTSLIREDDPSTATAKAVLNAINRRVATEI